MVIGFEQAMYFANESAREVVITVLLREGELGRPVTLDLTTMDGTAISKLSTMYGDHKQHAAGLPSVEIPQLHFRYDHYKLNIF